MEKEIGLELNKIAKPNVERSLLAMAIKGPDVFIQIKEQDVTYDMFLIEANGYIFQAIEYLYSKKQEPTPIALMEIIVDNHAKETIENFGGTEYLNILCETDVNLKNIESLKKIKSHDGFLIGGASKNIEDLLKIVNICKQ